MNPKHKGALGEVLACAWLLKRGYDVFRNISATGTADLVAWHEEDNELLLIDVTTSPSIAKNKVKIKPPNVKVLVVEPDGNCRWMRESTRFEGR